MAARSRARGDLTARRLRIVFCLDNMDVGGTEMNALRTALRLDRNSFEPAVACLRAAGPLATRYEAAGIEVLSLASGPLYSAKAARAGLGFARYLRRNAVDIVHSHDRYSNLFAVPWARAARVPVVIASKRWGQIAQPHRFANQVSYRLADRVLANSHAVATSLSLEDGVPAARIMVVPNFLDESAFVAPPGWREERRHALGIGAEALVIGTVANLRAIKDQASLIHAAALLRQRWPSLRVLIVGEGEERPALERLIRSLGLDGIAVLTGRLSSVPSPHHLFDVSVLCSLSEGSPNSILEAMAAARPVVATAVGGVPDTVVDGETGLLVPQSSPRALANALDQLLKDPDSRARMGAAGERRARAEFGATEIVGRLQDWYVALAAVGTRQCST